MSTANAHARMVRQPLVPLCEKPIGRLSMHVPEDVITDGGDVTEVENQPIPAKPHPGTHTHSTQPLDTRTCANTRIHVHT